MSLVLGIDNARIIASGTGEVIIDLPLTNRDGRQIETYLPKRITHYTQNLDFTNPEEQILDTILGYRITWDLSYSTFLDAEDVVKMVSIMELHKQGYSLTLIPRIDQDWRFFEVIPDNASLSLGISTGGYSGHNTDWNFRFITKNLEQSLKLQVAVAPELRNYTYGDNSFEEVLYAV